MKKEEKLDFFNEAISKIKKNHNDVATFSLPSA
jgi:hypothetical protein